MKKDKAKKVEVTEVMEPVVETVEEVTEVIEPVVETVEEVTEAVVEEVTEAVVEEVTEVIEPVVETVENNIPNSTDGVMGVVVKCAKLNVRQEPNKEANVVKLLDRKNSVMVDLDKSTDEFYYVYGSDFNGYCVKDFLEIK